MDISNIDPNVVELFALAYTVSQDLFDTSIEKASKRERSKIRAWINKTYICDGEYDDIVEQYIDKTVSDDDFFEFFKACYDLTKCKEAEKQRLFKAWVVSFL